MEFCRGKASFLQVKIATREPALWEKRAQKLGTLATFYDEEAGLFLLTFPARNVNATLRKLLELYPEADILEVGLRAVSGPQWYRRIFPGGLSVVSPGPGVTPEPRDLVVRSNLSFGSGYHPTTELSIRLLPNGLSTKCTTA